MKSGFFITCLLLVMAFPYWSIAQDWLSLGLENEPISVITVDWSNPEVIYAGSGSGFSAGTVGGIFKKHQWWRRLGYAVARGYCPGYRYSPA